MVNMYVMTFRFSLFGEFNRFTPTTNNIIKWSQAFQEKGYDFLPSVINTSIPVFPLIPAESNAVDNRLQFTSSKGDYIVRILANRIDVESTLLETDEVENKLTEISDVLNSLITIISDALGNPRGTRLAFFVDALSPEHEDYNYNKIYSGLNMGLSVNNSDNCIEWHHRFNERVELSVGSENESCNSIITIESAILNTQDKTSGQVSEIKGVHISADINTLPENRNERFDASNLIRFCSSAKDTFCDVLKQIELMFIK